MKQRMTLFWQTRSLREQKVLLAWSVIVGTGLLYFGLIAPLQQQITRLQHGLPTLEGQLFAMRALPADATRHKPVSVNDQGDLRSTLFQLLSTRNNPADLRSLSAERVELRLPEQALPEALALADSLRQDAHARITALSIKRDDADSPARVVIEMERIR